MKFDDFKWPEKRNPAFPHGENFLKDLRARFTSYHERVHGEEGFDTWDTNEYETAAEILFDVMTRPGRAGDKEARRIFKMVARRTGGKHRKRFQKKRLIQQVIEAHRRGAMAELVRKLVADRQLQESLGLKFGPEQQKTAERHLYRVLDEERELRKTLYAEGLISPSATLDEYFSGDYDL
jgi:hypothetical protein